MALEKSSGRGVSNSYGPRSAINTFPTQTPSEIAAFLRKTPRFKNAFINEYPTLIGKPYGRSGASAATAITPSGTNATIAVNYERTDPTTALPMAEVFIPAGLTNNQSIDYLDFAPIPVTPEDVWLLVVYIDGEKVPSNLVFQALVSDASSIAGVNFRSFTWSGQALQSGYNVLPCLQVEEFINTSTYGRVGTNATLGNWANTGEMTDTKPIRSVRVRTRLTSASGTDTTVHIGALYKAPPGWAKGAVVWSADDVPASFWELAVPVIESYGWKTTLNITTGYAGDPTAGNTRYMSVNQVREAVNTGHEIWNHTRLHDNLDTSTLDEKTISLTAARDWFNSNGISTASKFLAYPFGAYDDETITLLKSLGYKLGRTIVGQETSTWTPAINPFKQSAYLTEVSNSWKVDTHLNGAIKRGSSVFTYMHNAVSGGSDTNNYPESGAFYVEHLRRWCDLVKRFEEQNKVIVCTASEYYKLCGVDPLVDAFVE